MSYTNLPTRKYRSNALVFVLSLLIVVSLACQTAMPTSSPTELSPTLLIHPTATTGPAATVAKQPNDARRAIEPAAPAPLMQALQLAPAASQALRFTDWTAVKAATGYPGVTSAAPFETRRRFMRQVVERSLAPAAMDREFFILQAGIWGWDSSDLLWEASFHFEELLATTHVLAFRPGYDLTALTASLPAKGFTASEFSGMTLYSAPVDGGLHWSDSSPLALHNIVVLPEAGLLIASASPDSLHHVLAIQAGQATTLAAMPSVAVTAAELAGSTGAILKLGAATCQPYSPGFRERGGAVGLSQIEGLSLQPYPVLGAGFVLNDDVVAEQLLFHYADAVQADADLAARHHLLGSGTSMLRQANYGELFQIEGAGAAGGLQHFTLSATAELAVHPGWPQNLTSWILASDALFAACSVDDSPQINGLQ